MKFKAKVEIKPDGTIILVPEKKIQEMLKGLS